MVKTKTRTRNRSRRAPVGDRAQIWARDSLAAWSRFTWGTDTDRVFGLAKVPHVAVTWVVTAALIAAWVLRWGSWWKPLAGVTIAGLLYTAARAARHLPARRKAIDQFVAATRTQFKHPTGTLQRPVDPAQRVTVTRWRGTGHPAAGTVVADPASRAADPTGRTAAERAVEAAMGSHLKGEQAVLFSHPVGGVEFDVVDADDVRLVQQNTRRWIESVVHQLFPGRRGSEPTTVEVEFADPEDHGGRPDVPHQVTVGTGGTDTSSERFQDDVEKSFDARVERGVVFIYDWSTPGSLLIEGVDPESAEAARKSADRKISDTTVGAVASVSRAAAKDCTVTVNRWVDEGAGSAANTPTEITVALGTADFSATWDQRRLERSLDRALEQVWPDRVWLPEWLFGAVTSIDLVAVPVSHAKALRKRELNRLRQVVADKFPAKRGQEPPDVEVLEWATVEATQAGKDVIVARAKEATVTFGTVDVSRPEVRTAFESHFDSIIETNDCRYEWEAAKGLVHVTAVPVLPPWVAFPEPGTREFNEWNEAFRRGLIYIGPAKGGYRPAIDLNKSPHVLCGGSTGKGKSVFLTLFLFGALYNPDLYELVAIDPKVTDFTWVGGYPSVLTYAPTDARQASFQIAEAVKTAEARMQDRKNLLGMFPAVRNLRQLRKAIAEGKVDMPMEDVPKRLLVFFDEMGSAYTPSKDPDIKEIQDGSRTDMEQIGMLGRAMEVNIIGAAQKPSGDNIGTAMREQLVNRVAVGVLNSATSTQVLGNNLAAELLSDGSPLGRGIFVDDAGRQMVFQCYYLPDDDDEVEPHIATPDSPDGPPVHVTGVRSRVAERLTADGWEQITRTVQMTRVPESGPNKGQPVTFDTEQEEWIHSSQIEP